MFFLSKLASPTEVCVPLPAHPPSPLLPHPTPSKPVLGILPSPREASYTSKVQGKGRRGQLQLSSWPQSFHQTIIWDLFLLPYKMSELGSHMRSAQMNLLRKTHFTIQSLLPRIRIVSPVPISGSH